MSLRIRDPHEEAFGGSMRPVHRRTASVRNPVVGLARETGQNRLDLVLMTGLARRREAQNRELRVSGEDDAFDLSEKEEEIAELVPPLRAYTVPTLQVVQAKAVSSALTAKHRVFANSITGGAYVPLVRRSTLAEIMEEKISTPDVHRVATSSVGEAPNEFPTETSETTSPRSDSDYLGGDDAPQKGGSHPEPTHASPPAQLGPRGGGEKMLPGATHGKRGSTARLVDSDSEEEGVGVSWDGVDIGAPMEKGYEKKKRKASESNAKTAEERDLMAVPGQPPLGEDDHQHVGDLNTPKALKTSRKKSFGKGYRMVSNVEDAEKEMNFRLCMLIGVPPTGFKKNDFDLVKGTYEKEWFERFGNDILKKAKNVFFAYFTVRLAMEIAIRNNYWPSVRGIGRKDNDPKRENTLISTKDYHGAREGLIFDKNNQGEINMWPPVLRVEDQKELPNNIEEFPKKFLHENGKAKGPLREIMWRQYHEKCREKIPISEHNWGNVVSSNAFVSTWLRYVEPRTGPVMAKWGRREASKKGLSDANESEDNESTSEHLRMIWKNLIYPMCNDGETEFSDLRVRREAGAIWRTWLHKPDYLVEDEKKGDKKDEQDEDEQDEDEQDEGVKKDDKWKGWMNDAEWNKKNDYEKKMMEYKGAGLFPPFAMRSSSETRSEGKKTYRKVEWNYLADGDNFTDFCDNWPREEFNNNQLDTKFGKHIQLDKGHWNLKKSGRFKYLPWRIGEAEVKAQKASATFFGENNFMDRTSCEHGFEQAAMPC